MRRENIVLKSSVKLIEKDKNGNPIVYIEASNKSVDTEGERVNLDYLFKCKNVFLNSGVISHDHRHVRPYNMDDKKRPHQNILGKPLDVFLKNGKVCVKAVLDMKKMYLKRYLTPLRIILLKRL